MNDVNHLPGEQYIQTLDKYRYTSYPSSIKLRQASETWDSHRAVPAPLIRQRRQIPTLQTRLIAPKRRILRLPRPIEPAPTLFKRIHLRLRPRLQERLVVVAERGAWRVGLVAAA